ncbi:hypothetical protein CBL_21434, partial [Carabus blaptoides fortunei]
HSPRKIVKTQLETPDGQRQMDQYGAQFGDIATKYLKYFVSAEDAKLDKTYGIRKDPVDGKFKIGNQPVSIEHNDIMVAGKFYTGTRGLYELLFKAHPENYTAVDLNNYIQIVKFGEYDSNERRIVNLGSPQRLYDAVTKSYVDKRVHDLERFISTYTLVKKIAETKERPPVFDAQMTLIGGVADPLYG